MTIPAIGPKRPDIDPKIPMNHEKSCAGVDLFRTVAAFLVVAIHTSPLASFSVTGDFFLTRVLARLAVPFFFTASGFFMISCYSCGCERLKKFVSRTLCIYGAAILLCLPLNVYNHYFEREPLLPTLIRDLVFDGTLYHLWYLPASALGGAIAWYLVRKWDYKRAFAAAWLLYLTGLGGDSYFGLTEQIAGSIPALGNFYGRLFEIMDQTRNGLFFAPLFFVCGGWMADRGRTLSLRQCLGGGILSFAMLCLEAAAVHLFGWPRFDSMYLLLPVCGFFLFQLLLQWRGRRFRSLRTFSLLVYLLHPLMIVAVRFLARPLRLQELLVENSAVHFLAVCLLTSLFAAAWAWLEPRFRGKNCEPDSGSKDTGRAWIEIDLSRLLCNARTLRELAPSGCELMAVVKASAYGHGAFRTASALEKAGVHAFAVATIDEAAALRSCGIRGEILVLGYTDVRRATELKRYDLIQTLTGFEYAEELNRRGIPVKTHLKIDTGMRRLGVPWDRPDQTEAVLSMPNLRVCGLFSHLCCADSPDAADIDFTQEQIRRFYSLTERLEQDGFSVPKLHIQSSYGLLNVPGLRCDYVRPGIALYGVHSSPDCLALRSPALRPVLSLKARVVLIRQLRTGESCGYGRAFTASRDARLAILSIGYADGVPRSLSCGKGRVLIRGRYAPIAGRICMDQLFADVTDIPGVSIGDIATLIGEDGGAALSAPDVAWAASTISNELLSRLGGRLPVVVRETGGAPDGTAAQSR